MPVVLRNVRGGALSGDGFNRYKAFVDRKSKLPSRRLSAVSIYLLGGGYLQGNWRAGFCRVGGGLNSLRHCKKCCVALYVLFVPGCYPRGSMGVCLTFFSSRYRAQSARKKKKGEFISLSNYQLGLGCVKYRPSFRSVFSKMLYTQNQSFHPSRNRHSCAHHDCTITHLHPIPVQLPASLIPPFLELDVSTQGGKALHFFFGMRANIAIPSLVLIVSCLGYNSLLVPAR